MSSSSTAPPATVPAAAPVFGRLLSLETGVVLGAAAGLVLVEAEALGDADALVLADGEALCDGEAQSLGLVQVTTPFWASRSPLTVTVRPSWPGKVTSAGVSPGLTVTVCAWPLFGVSVTVTGTPSAGLLMWKTRPAQVLVSDAVGLLPPGGWQFSGFFHPPRKISLPSTVTTMFLALSAGTGRSPTLLCATVTVFEKPSSPVTLKSAARLLSRLISFRSTPPVQSGTSSTAGLAAQTPSPPLYHFSLRSP